MPASKRSPTAARGASPGRPTIADVARAAGVSKATVSRFFNHRERLLTPDIAGRVEAAVARLGYTPSPMAQALKRGRSRLIGLVVADISNPFSVAVLRGAERACQDAGYLVMLFNLGNDSGREREAVEALTAYRVEGLILNTLGRDAGGGHAARHGQPVVLVDRRHDDMQADFVSLDNAGAVKARPTTFSPPATALLWVSEPLGGSARASSARRPSAPGSTRIRRRRAAVSSSATSAIRRARRGPCARCAGRRRAPAGLIAANAVVTLASAGAAAASAGSSAPNSASSASTTPNGRRWSARG